VKQVGASPKSGSDGAPGGTPHPTIIRTATIIVFMLVNMRRAWVFVKGGLFFRLTAGKFHGGLALVESATQMKPENTC